MHGENLKLYLFYSVSIILSMAQELFRRILFVEARIHLHISTSGFVVDKLAI